ncbi:RNA polymerase sigma factor [Streptomyces sp. NBC_01483]|uniref:RNA polymerase sigma factor n=1 Tax=Streptomyces sp. NBC_01483 TaxID=2903883 RepID=UPI003FCCF916
MTPPTDHGQRLPVLGPRRPDGPPTGWLFKVARQRLQDARESHTRNGILIGADALHDTTADPDPITTCDQWLDILAAISKLPPRQQEAVALGQQFGLPYKEIAEIMGASPATVRAHVHQAHRTLEAMPGDDKEGGTHEDQRAPPGGCSGDRRTVCRPSGRSSRALPASPGGPAGQRKRLVLRYQG